MNISFKKDDPLNSVIFDTNTRRTLYKVNTPWSLGGGKTTIRRVDFIHSPAIAQIDWGSLISSDKVRFTDQKGKGKWVEVKQFLAKDGFFSSSRRFMAPDGHKYKWKYHSHRCLLIDCQTKAVVAESHPRKRHFFRKSRDMNLSVSSQVLEIMDIVLLTFIIMEKERRDKEKIEPDDIDKGDDGGGVDGGGGDGGGGGGGGGGGDGGGGGGGGS